MNIYDYKYNKYKIKYLNLKINQTSGSMMRTLNTIKYISGPIVIKYLSNDFLNKKIIIMGDKHEDKEGVCPMLDSITITDYIQRIIIDNTSIIDFFIEIDLPRHRSSVSQINQFQNGIGSDIDFMRELKYIAFDNYKKNPNFRIHFTDIRYSIDGWKEFDIFDSVLNHGKKNDPDIAVRNIFRLYKTITIKYNTFLTQLYSIINQLCKDATDETCYLPYLGIPYQFSKEINKLFTFLFIEEKKLLLNILLKNIKIYLDSIEEEQDIRLDNIDKIYEIYRKGMYASAYITDLYLIARILKSKEIKNCILYNGYNHVNSIQDYLDVLSFNIDYVERSRKNYIRCIKITQSFLDYFAK